MQPPQRHSPTDHKGFAAVKTQHTSIDHPVKAALCDAMTGFYAGSSLIGVIRVIGAIRAIGGVAESC